MDRRDGQGRHLALHGSCRFLVSILDLRHPNNCRPDSLLVPSYSPRSVLACRHDRPPEIDLMIVLEFFIHLVSRGFSEGDHQSVVLTREAPRREDSSPDTTCRKVHDGAPQHKLHTGGMVRLDISRMG